MSISSLFSFFFPGGGFLLGQTLLRVLNTLAISGQELADKGALDLPVTADHAVFDDLVATTAFSMAL
jgi:hypothetical protein